MLYSSSPSTMYWALSSFRTHGPRPFSHTAEYLVYSDNHRVAPAEAEAEALREGLVPETQGWEATLCDTLLGTDVERTAVMWLGPGTV